MTGWQTTRELLGTASARVTQDGVGPEGQSLAGWRHRHVAHLRQVPRPRRLCPLPPSRAGTTGGDGSLGRGQTRGGDLRRATAPAGPALVWGPEALAAVGTVQTHRGLAFLSARRPFHVELGVRLPQPLPACLHPDHTGQVAVGALSPGSVLPRCPGHLSACLSGTLPEGAHRGVCCTDPRGRTPAPHAAAT